MRSRLATAALALTLVTLAFAAPAAAAESNGGVRIMPLGDSITAGYTVPGGYRTGLWQRLAAAGRLTDFVGTGSNGPAALGDHDHEGHSGWRIDQLDANITGWLRTANPRTILLHIGTNDISQNYDVAGAPGRLATLIDHIRLIEPNVELFVAQLIPNADATNEARISTFNAALPGIVAQQGPLTHLVRMHSALTTADLADGLHPDATGYDRMAARWWSALQSVPESLTPLTVPPAGSPALLTHAPSTRCLAVPGTGVNGGQATIQDCTGRPNQRWTRTTAGELRAFGTFCLDVSAGGTVNGTKIQSYTCNGTPAQKFTVNPNGTVTNAASFKCVDVAANGTANGTLVRLWDCNATPAQRWSVR
jgi:lysophospholipase L1-like esterase